MATSVPVRSDRRAAPTHMPTRVIDEEGNAICDHCTVADTFLARFRGLMGRRELVSGEGLLLRPAGSVHTCFMRFAIDVVFLDRELRVVRVAEDVRPWRAVAARRGRAVLEMAAGDAARRGLTVGQRLRIEEGSDDDE
jgi:uncharacterized membrane protein (UPF0127 family)